MPVTEFELVAGKEKPVRLLFVSEGELFYVVPERIPSAWFSAAVRDGACDIRWSGREGVPYSAALVSDPAIIERVRLLFEAKYGRATWNRYFSGRNVALRIGSPTEPAPVEPEERIRREFDSVAEGYDANLSRKPIDRYLKERTVELALSALAAPGPILEIGPGTGFHTLPLLRAGHPVLAIDTSDLMLTQLRRNARRAGLESGLTTRTARLAEIDATLADVPAGQFTGAFSAFGAFNLEPNTERAVQGLSRLLAPGGVLAFTSLNRPGIVPLFWELALLRPRAGGYRLRNVVPVDGVRYPLELYPRSPKDWDRTLGAGFRRTSAHAVSVLAPPFDSPRAVRFLGARGSARARAWDDFFTSGSRISWAAEWVFLSYLRNPSAADPSKQSADPGQRS